MLYSSSPFLSCSSLPSLSFPAEFSEDDLAGLLSDSDDDNQPIKKPILRPKHSLTDAHNYPDASADSDPITSTPKQNTQAPVAIAAGIDKNPGDPSFVSPVLSRGGNASQESKTGVLSKKQNAGAAKFSDADTDDLLGDLGLGEDDDIKPASSKRPSFGATVATSSPGLHKPALSSSNGVVGKEMATKSNHVVESDNDLSDKEDDNGGNEFSFGSYLPSVGSSTPARKALGLSLGKGEGSVHNSFTPSQSKSPHAKSVGRADSSGLSGGRGKKTTPSSTKKLVRFALQENGTDVGENARTTEKKEPRSFQQEQLGLRAGESPGTTGSLAILSRNRTLSAAAADNSKETVSDPLAPVVGGSEEVQPHISPNITAKKEGALTSGRRSRRRPATIPSSSRRLFESDEDIPHEPERDESTQVTVRANQEIIGQKEPGDQVPPLDPEMEARAHDLDSFQTPTQSSSPAGLQRQAGKRGIAKNGELESTNLPKTPSDGMQAIPGVDDIELKVGYSFDKKRYICPLARLISSWPHTFCSCSEKEYNLENFRCGII